MAEHSYADSAAFNPTQNGNYSWYAVADDSFDNSTSINYTFSTFRAWDLNENNQIEPADISIFVSYYGEVCTNGQYSWDINSNGDADPADASLLVSYYGDVYTAIP